MRMSYMNQRRTRIYEGKAKILYEGPEPGTLDRSLQGRRHRLQCPEKSRHRRQGRAQQPHLGIDLHPPQRARPAHPFPQAPQHARAARPRSRDHPARSRGAQCRGGLAAKRLGIEEGTALPRSIIEFYYKNDELRRSDGVGRAHHRVQLGQPPGDRRHHGAGDPHQRFHVRASSSASASSSSISRSSSAGFTKTT